MWHNVNDDADIRPNSEKQVMVVVNQGVEPSIDVSKGRGAGQSSTELIRIVEQGSDEQMDFTSDLKRKRVDEGRSEPTSIPSGGVIPGRTFLSLEAGSGVMQTRRQT